MPVLYVPHCVTNCMGPDVRHPQTFSGDHLAPHLKQRRQTATTEAKTPENALQDLKAQMRHVVSTVNEMLDLLQEYPELPEPDEKDWLVWQLSAHGEALVDVRKPAFLHATVTCTQEGSYADLLAPRLRRTSMMRRSRS